MPCRRSISIAQKSNMAPLFTDRGDAALFSAEDESPTSISENGPLSPSSSDGEVSFRVKQQGRSSVSFKPGASVLVYAGISIDDYSPEERRQCWYHFDELRDIRTEVKDTVALMNENNLPLNATSHGADDVNDDGMEMKTHITHGLEGKTKEGKRQRKENRMASLAAVFDEQNLQDMDGISDPVMIARAYTEFSYSSQVAAFQRASLFQEEVAAIYLSMEDLSIDEDDNVDIASTDTSGSAIIDSPVGSTYCDSNEFPSTSEEAEKEKAEQDEIFYECNSSSISDNFEANPKPAAGTSSSADENINREGLENEEGATGPLTIRDRFAYLLPRSASSKRSAMGDFVVVHV